MKWTLFPVNISPLPICRLLTTSVLCLTAYLTVLFFAASLIAGIYAVFTPADAGVIERTEKKYGLQRQKYARSIEEVMRITRYWIATNPGDPDDLSTPLPDAWGYPGIDLMDQTIPTLHPSSVMNGIKARYCASILLVYLDDPNQKGIGPDDLRLIQTARVKAHIQSTRRNAPGRPAPLQWLGVGGQIESSSHYSNSPPQVPSCMNSGLPSGRPVLIDRVVDPATRGFDREQIDTRAFACPKDWHGISGVILRRTGTSRYNGKRGGWQGPTVWNSEWPVLDNRNRLILEDLPDLDIKFSSCREDYTEVKTVRWDCQPYDPANPLAANYGEITKKFSAGTYRSPYAIANDKFPFLVSFSAYKATRSTCSGVSPGTIPDLPAPTNVNTKETKSSGCPSGYTGSVSLARTKTVRTTTFPWKQRPITTTFYSNWAQTGSSCRRPPPPPLACYKGQKGGQDQDNYYVTRPNTGQRRGSLWRVSMSRCRGGSSRSRDEATHDADGDGVDRDIDRDDNNDKVGAGGRANDGGGGGGHSRDGNANDGEQ